jgi:site-specific DNA recombinase
MSNRTVAVGYCRVSTTSQAEDGCSIAAQRDRLERYAALYGIELVGIEEDAALSASHLERPGLQRALAMLQSGAANALLVVKLDRLTRSIRDVAALIESYFGDDGAALLSVNDSIDTRSASGRLVLNMLVSVSQWEREVIAERTSDAMRFMRSRGEYTGGVTPYGFRAVNGEFVPDEAEQAIIAVAVDLRSKDMSLRAIGTELERRGLLPRNRRAWGPEQIRSLLRRAA